MRLFELVEVVGKGRDFVVVVERKKKSRKRRKNVFI